jgi:hypothetical protein
MKTHQENTITRRTMMDQRMGNASMSRTVWLVLVLSAFVMWFNMVPVVQADSGNSIVPIDYVDSTEADSSGGGVGDSVTVVVEGETSISMTILLELWGLLF